MIYVMLLTKRYSIKKAAKTTQRPMYSEPYREKLVIRWGGKMREEMYQSGERFNKTARLLPSSYSAPDE